MRRSLRTVSSGYTLFAHASVFVCRVYFSVQEAVKYKRCKLGFTVKATDVTLLSLDQVRICNKQIYSDWPEKTICRPRSDAFSGSDHALHCLPLIKQ